jgi:hypothetical protein
MIALFFTVSYFWQSWQRFHSLNFLSNTNTIPSLVLSNYFTAKMKYWCAVALAGFAALSTAAPIVDTSGKKPGGDMLTRRQGKIYFL